MYLVKIITLYVDSIYLTNVLKKIIVNTSNSTCMG